jgi:nitrate reductase NapE component
MRPLFRNPKRPAWLALVFLMFVLYPLPGHFVERQNRREVLAHGKEAVALVESSSGLQRVVISWSDLSGSNVRTRTGEAWTRKQVDGLQFVGTRVAIKYIDDPAVMPVILSEVAAREWANEFGLYWSPLIAITLVGALIGFVAWIGARFG